MTHPARSLLFIVICCLIALPKAEAAGKKTLNYFPIIDWQKTEIQTPKDLLPLKNQQLLPAAQPSSFEKTLQKQVSTLSTMPTISCPQDLAGLTDGWEVFTSQISNKAAASLNYFVEADLSDDDQVILYNFVYYKDIFGPGIKVAYRCGAGVMLALKVSRTDGKASLSLPFLAASAELGHAKVEFRMKTIGVSGAEINKIVPDAQRIGAFDTKGYAETFSTINKLRDVVAKGGAGVTVVPRPLAISFQTVDPTKVDIGLARVHALKSILSKHSCSKSQDQLPGTNEILEKEVEIVYYAVTGNCGSWSSPDDSEAQKAATLLTRFKIN